MTIEQYKYLYSICGNADLKFDNILEDNILNIISILSKKDINYIENLPIKKYKKIYKKYIANKKYIPELWNKKWFYFDKNIWFLKDLNKLKWGDFVDCNYYIDKDVIYNIDKLIFKIYIPLRNVNTIPNFDTLNLNEVYFNITKIIELNNTILTNYKGLFDNTFSINENDVDKKMLGEFKTKKEKINKYKLLDVTYQLANNDITKIENINNKTVYEIFNYLTWQLENQNNTNK